MKQIKNILLVVTIFLKLSNCARILAVIPTPSYSHQIAFKPLWRELSKRHEIVLLTAHPSKDHYLTNLTEIDLSFTIKYVEEEYEMDKKLFQASGNILDFLKDIFLVRLYTNNKILDLPEVQNLIHNHTQHHFDLLISEVNVQSFLPFSYLYNIPVIQVVSIGHMPEVHTIMGSFNHPLLYPPPFLPIHTPATFFERFILSVVPYSLMFFSKYKFNGMINDSIKKYFGEDCPDYYELLKNTSIVFEHTNIVFHKPRPVAPGIVAIGGMHIEAPQPLIPEIQEYMDNSKHGVIFFSLGTSVKSKDVSPDIRKVIMDTFRELPYDVLWKFELPELEGKPDNVKIIKWAQQQDILRHPNLKLFITQGGLQSIEEALYTHNAMLVLPVAGDQGYNAKMVVSRGYGKELNLKTMDKEIFKSTILELINNPAYKNTVKEMAELSLDQPMTSLERAVWWTEYVIRHKGAKHLKGPAVDMPMYQYLMLDVIGFCLAVITIFIYITYRLLKFIINRIRRLLSYSSSKKNN